MNLTWKVPGLYKADANLVAAEIEAIGEKAEPEDILEKARDQSTELHKCFIWDDTVAAEKWRLHTARLIVCNIVVQRVEREEDKPQVRYFYKAEGAGYKPTATIIKRQDEYQAMLQRAYAELAAFKRKYGALAEFEELIALFP